MTVDSASRDRREAACGQGGEAIATDARLEGDRRPLDLAVALRL